MLQEEETKDSFVINVERLVIKPFNVLNYSRIILEEVWLRIALLKHAKKVLLQLNTWRS